MENISFVSVEKSILASDNIHFFNLRSHITELVVVYVRRLCKGIFYVSGMNW